MAAAADRALRETILHDGMASPGGSIDAFEVKCRKASYGDAGVYEGC